MGLHEFICTTCVQYLQSIGQMKVSDPFQLELQLIVIHRVWLLGTEPGSFARAVNTLNHGAISPAFRRPPQDSHFSVKQYGPLHVPWNAQTRFKTPHEKEKTK